MSATPTPPRPEPRRARLLATAHRLGELAAWRAVAAHAQAQVARLLAQHAAERRRAAHGADRGAR